MIKLASVKAVVDTIPHVSITVCPDCLGSGTETLVGTNVPCESCDGTGFVRYLEVLAVVQVPSNVRHDFDVITKGE